MTPSAGRRAEGGYAAHFGIGAAACLATICASVAMIAAPPAHAATALQNRGLESDTNSDAVPDCWKKSGYGTNNYAFTRTSDAHSGSSAERLTISSLSSGDRKLLTNQDSGTCAPTVTAGQAYTLGAWVKGNAYTRFVVYLRNSAGAWSYWMAGPRVGATSSWTQKTWKTPAVPSGSTAISFGLNLSQVGTITTDDYSFVRPSDTSSTTPTTSSTTTTTAPAPAPTTSTSTMLFSESFDQANASGSVWGTPTWDGDLASGWHGDGGTFYSVKADRPANVGDTMGQTSMQRWWERQSFTGNHRVSVDVKPTGWDSGASSKSTWAGFTFYLRRQLDQNESGFYGLSAYIYNGQVHVEKKCVGSTSSSRLAPFETGKLPSGQPYAYYLLSNVGNLPIAQNSWHKLESTATNNADGSVTLRIYRDGAKITDVTDAPGLTGCAPYTAGRAGWRSDSARYELDNFQLTREP